MSGLCLTAAALTIALPFQQFTLAWTHSIEKIRWEEDYRLAGAMLELTEARIRGFGAGMEPPPDARLAHGVWHYRPALHAFERLRLARSDFVADYSLCVHDACRPLADWAGTPQQAPEVEIAACR